MTRTLSVLFTLAMSITTSAQSSIRLWDGSSISTAEVDATVTRLMKAGEVTGVGIAILNDGKMPTCTATASAIPRNSSPSRPIRS